MILNKKLLLKGMPIFTSMGKKLLVSTDLIFTLVISFLVPKEDVMLLKFSSQLMITGSLSLKVNQFPIVNISLEGESISDSEYLN